MERVVNTKIELARQRDVVAQAAGGEVLAKFVSELSEISVRQAEMEAQLGVARDQLRKAETALAQGIVPTDRIKAFERRAAEAAQAEERLVLWRCCHGLAYAVVLRCQSPGVWISV